MTSSLVGSEMCIRDRYDIECEAIAKDPNEDAAAVVYAQEALHKHKPVSYTHLTLPTICSV
eukprot:1484400-Prorocentrum_lima.AAC.1